MKETGKLTRTANKIQGALSEFQRHKWEETHTQLTKYCEQLKELTSESGKLGKSLTHNWFEAARICSSRIDRLLNDISYSIQQMKQFTARHNQDAPKLRSLFDELSQLQQEFTTVELEEDENIISVMTEPITLEDVYLGPFKIQLDLNRLSYLYRESSYFVIALDPNPAATSEDVTHPHVSNEKLCEGDGHTAIQAALEEGRLCDFFTMVKGVLNTYNPDSPYVSLYDWDGTSCYDCGYVTNREDVFYCHHCDRDYCLECSTYCRSCDETICLGCAGQCQVCEEPTCSSCARKCSACNRYCCGRCMEDDLCEDCKELMEIENEQQEIEETEDNQSKETNESKQGESQGQPACPQVQPNSMGQAAVLQGQNR